MPKFMENVLNGFYANFQLTDNRICLLFISKFSCFISSAGVTGGCHWARHLFKFLEHLQSLLIVWYF